ncbi:MAG: EamA family transporter RarD [Candidatus Planktophila sp.]|nr:EamA family transporter RarD [Candidatus Planktophila sp.]
MTRYKTGLIFGVSAYTLWGAFPLYWPLLQPASPMEIVSHRAVWSLFFCLVALGIAKQLKSTYALLKIPRVFFRLLFAAGLISVNWLVYIWGVNNEHVVETALGYYINPLIIIAFGVIMLREKMRKLQWVAVSFGALGVIVLTIDYGRLPWIALALAFSWGSYGLVKKQLNLGALEGLAIETLLSLPFYGGYLIYIGLNGTGQLGSSLGLSLLLIGAGVVTAIPLLLFNGSTTRLPFTIIGLLQYITPTIQFSIGVWVRHEDMPTARWVGFMIIWAALITLAIDLLKSGRTVNNSVAQG